MLNIYKVTQTGDFGWDQYRGFVCITTDADRAWQLSPEGPDENGNPLWDFIDRWNRWVRKPSDIVVEHIGTALPDAVERIVSINFRNG